MSGLENLPMLLLLPNALMTALNVLSAPRLRVGRNTPVHPAPKISLLIPARDEVHNLPRLLDSVRAQDDPELEILVLDDHSTDGTAELASSYPEARFIPGAPLPEGWRGKNWACHQLAAAASGELLIFCDADLRLRGPALQATADTLTRLGLEGLSALPHQTLGTPLQAAVIPIVMQFQILAWLPLRWLRYLRAPSLALANGQWLALSRTLYERIGGHESVRTDAIEDLAIARRIQAVRGRFSCVLAPDFLAAHMYRDDAGLRAGFGKNLYGIWGGREGPFWAALSWLVGASLLLPLMDLRALGVLLGMRMAGALTMGDRAGRAFGMAGLHPWGVIEVARIALRSRADARQGTLTWKGRPIR